MTSRIPAAELTHVSIRFQNKPVVNDVTALFPLRALTVICGPSGSGKSTLLRTLCRLNDRVRGFQMKGEVKVMGQNILDPALDPGRLRRRVGYLFQNPCMLHGSILENVLFGFRHHRPDLAAQYEDHSRSALQQVGLWGEVKDRLQESAGKLSLGQQQRLALARVLILEPDLILLDEPTASLDPLSARRIEELALNLKETNSLVWVTHNEQQSERLADQVLHLGPVAANL